MSSIIVRLGGDENMARPVVRKNKGPIRVRWVNFISEVGTVGTSATYGPVQMWSVPQGYAVEILRIHAVVHGTAGANNEFSFNANVRDDPSEKSQSQTPGDDLLAFINYSCSADATANVATTGNQFWTFDLTDPATGEGYRTVNEIFMFEADRSSAAPTDINVSWQFVYRFVKISEREEVELFMRKRA